MSSLGGALAQGYSPVTLPAILPEAPWEPPHTIFNGDDDELEDDDAFGDDEAEPAEAEGDEDFLEDDDEEVEGDAEFDDDDSDDDDEF